jgi:hypothetical protein
VEEGTQSSPSGAGIIGDANVWRVIMGSSKNNSCAAGGGAIYGLGIFGAFVFFWQQADSFWSYAFTFFQALFWPAFMVYEVFAALGS